MIFRYPGGKKKLLPVIMHHLCPRIERSEAFCDLFVGGGSVAIEVAKTYPTIKIIVNDIDKYMSSFWSMVAEGTNEEWNKLEELIRIQPTINIFNSCRNLTAKNKIHRTYYAIFFNRCTFSGIHHAGPIGGKDQAGKYKVDCRYNAKKIIEGCRELRRLFANRLVVSSVHFAEVLRVLDNNVALYCDPPYFKKGKELYPCFMNEWEHEHLAWLLINERNRWVLSYDHCDEIQELYKKANCITISALVWG